MAFARIEREAPPKGFEISWPGAFPFLLSRDLFLQEGFFVGQEFTEAQFYELKGLQRRHECKAQALRYLAMREHTRFELVQKLKRKGFESSEFSVVLDELSDENLLSEYRYARLFVEQRLRKRGEGRALMAQRLGAKRVNRTDALRVLDEFYREELVHGYVQKAYEEIVATVGEELSRAHLQKRGFSSSEIRLALDEYEGEGGRDA